MSKNIVRLKGKNINLCVLRTDEEALMKYVEWLNNEEFNMWLGRASSIMSIEEERKWAEDCDTNHLRFSIVTKDDTLIGSCSLRKRGVNDYTLGIIIGEECGRDKGYGTEVIGLLLKFAFDNLAAHRVELGVMADNLRARACYKKNGFREFGCRHECAFYKGKYNDVILMEILENEYRERMTKK